MSSSASVRPISPRFGERRYHGVTMTGAPQRVSYWQVVNAWVLQPRRHDWQGRGEAINQRH